ncbi:helix-turn-helix domain-containing protein [Pseudoalteromonas sp. Of7M-16]|uniref:helix-turn-helix domain-containing protein n=1 Tax=Pseudoalteromonas sp. Of7M-16 TaxID=2917756 RepID=UPI001EF4F03F|nr:helix-turn-helix domain-containing protein [Pseudoalteromonas sp. Of7M-16]MCG7550920.1 helix-turn-helix domain-containing protein [Pseudoalteromonas sp. Of7M-16]
MQLNEYIKQEIEKQMSLSQAAKKIEVSASTLTRLCGGQSSLTPEMAAKLEALGLCYKQLFEMQKNENIEKVDKILNG